MGYVIINRSIGISYWYSIGALSVHYSYTICIGYLYWYQYTIGTDIWYTIGANIGTLSSTQFLVHNIRSDIGYTIGTDIGRTIGTKRTLTVHNFGTLSGTYCRYSISTDIAPPLPYTIGTLSVHHQCPVLDTVSFETLVLALSQTISSLSDTLHVRADTVGTVSKFRYTMAIHYLYTSTILTQLSSVLHYRYKLSLLTIGIGSIGTLSVRIRAHSRYSISTLSVLTIGTLSMHSIDTLIALNYQYTIGTDIGFDYRFWHYRYTIGTNIGEALSVLISVHYRYTIDALSALISVHYRLNYRYTIGIDYQYTIGTDIGTLSAIDIRKALSVRLSVHYRNTIGTDIGTLSVHYQYTISTLLVHYFYTIGTLSVYNRYTICIDITIDVHYRCTAMGTHYRYWYWCNYWYTYPGALSVALWVH